MRRMISKVLYVFASLLFVGAVVAYAGASAGSGWCAQSYHSDNWS